MFQALPVTFAGLALATVTTGALVGAVNVINKTIAATILTGRNMHAGTIAGRTTPIVLCGN